MSGRKEVYEEYKGQRESKPDLLAEQWPHMQPLVDSFGYENVRVEGFEADDVIATRRAPRARRGLRGDGRDRRSRPLPADRARACA